MRKFLWLAGVLIGWLAGAEARAEEAAPVPAVECRARAGLPNVLAKVQKPGPVNVAYLGGSITAAPGWRPKSLAWLKSTYPAATFVEINAAIGGTGSDLGVFRLQHDVLAHKPDLLFVEFAVNDGGADPHRIHQAMEGIVRQTWQADPNTDICFVYTVSEPQLPDLQKGNCQRSAAAMDALADHYGIPSIHFGVEVARLVREGKVIFKGDAAKGAAPANAPMVFSTDGVHPLPETGHELYLQSIVRSWVPIGQASGTPAPHALKEPLVADHWAHAKMIPLRQEMMRGDWQKLEPAHGNMKAFFGRMGQLWQAKAPGASLSFAFNGTFASIYDLLGPDGGAVSVKVDDQPEKKANRIDGYCTYTRTAKLDIGTLPAGPHRVTVTLLPDAPDKKNILFEKNRPDLEKNPAKYQDNAWYASAVFLLGDLVP